MTITRLLVFRLQNSLFAIPVNSLASIAAVAPEEIKKENDKQFYFWQGEKVPLVQSLLSNYNYPSSLLSSQQQTVGIWERSQLQTAGKEMVLLIAQGKEIVGIKVDQILVEQDLVIKPFGKAITPPNHISGCTILGDGRLVTLLDGLALIERAFSKSTVTKSLIIPTQILPKIELPVILVVDDSLTTRQTLSKTLQKAGYRVIQAQDGVDGLAQLEQNPQIQGVICDVEMPNMNGFEFLGRCRKQYAQDVLPVLMLTSRSSKRYRQLAKQLGSNGYLTKPYLDRELVETLQGCLEKSAKHKVAI